MKKKQYGKYDNVFLRNVIVYYYYEKVAESKSLLPFILQKWRWYCENQ